MLNSQINKLIYSPKIDSFPPTCNNLFFFVSMQIKWSGIEKEFLEDMNNWMFNLIIYACACKEKQRRKNPFSDILDALLFLLFSRENILFVSLHAVAVTVSHSCLIWIWLRSISHLLLFKNFLLLREKKLPTC